MPVAIQIREVPDEVRDALAARAASLGQSLQAYLLGVVEREAALLRNQALFAGYSLPHGGLRPGTGVVAEIRAMREERDAEIVRRIT